MHPVAATSLLFLGCCSDVIFLELIVKDDPGSGNIITFFRFLFIALEGFIFTKDFGRRKSVVPLPKYVNLVLFVFVTSVINNVALNFNISMPLHMIFRSGSLITSMALGIIILNRRYPLFKWISVIMITVGVGTCTIESGRFIAYSSNSNVTDSTNSENGAGDINANDELYELMIWIAGVAMMTASLFLSARMGLYQESLSLEFGKNPKEALFYSHALPLPGFLLLATDIYNHAVIFNRSAPLDILGTPIPRLWVFLFANVVTNYVCSTSAFMLASECSSLTVTLAVTLRKFVSLLLSIVYFSNPFTFYHWTGTALVFIGTLIFTEAHLLPSKLWNTITQKPAQRDTKKHDGEPLVNGGTAANGLHKRKKMVENGFVQESVKS